jgi:hypothetical protein
MKDDKTGLRQLSNVDLVTYAVGRKRLTPLELELTMRLEQVIEQRLEVLDKLPRLACATCPTFAHLMPRDLDDVAEELVGDTIWE